MKKFNIIIVVLALIVALTTSLVMPVFAYSNFPYREVVYTFNQTNYVPTLASDYTVLVGGEYYQLVLYDNNHNYTPLNWDNFEAGTVVKVWSRFESRYYGVNIWYGTENNLTLVWSNNTMPGNSVPVNASVTIDLAYLQTAGISEVQGGGFYATSYGSSAGQFCFTCDPLGIPVTPPTEWAINVSYTGVANKFYILSDLDYDSVFSGSYEYIINSAVDVSIVYTASVDDSDIGNYQLVKSLSSGKSSITEEDVEDLAIVEGGRFAVYYNIDQSGGGFSYKLKQTTTGSIIGSISGFFSDLISRLGTWFSNLASSIVDGFTTVLERVFHFDLIEGLISDAEEIGREHGGGGSVRPGEKELVETFFTGLDPDAVSAFVSIYDFPIIHTFILAIAAIGLVAIVIRLFVTL